MNVLDQKLTVQVRWGFENLRLNKSDLDALGATGLVPEINITCMDHVGGHLAKFQQWDAENVSGKLLVTGLKVM